MVVPMSECYNFVVHGARGRWTSIFASFLIMATSGATYILPIYSKDIKRNLGYSQSMLSTLSTWNEIGSNAGILSGLVAEVTPTKFMLVVSSVANFLSYLMIWLAVTEKIHRPQFWLMCVYMFIGANAQNFATTTSLVTSVKNFPERRSMVLGLLKGYFGLSGPILTQIYVFIYGDDSTSSILLAAWLPTSISLIVMYTVGEKAVKIKQPNELKAFFHFLYLSAVLAVYLMTMALVKEYVAFSRVANVGSAVALCIFLFAPVVVASRQEIFIWRQMKAPPTTIIVESPQSVEQEQNSSANQAEEDTIIVEEEQNSSADQAEEDTIIVEEDQNSSEETKTYFFAAIFNKPERGQDYGILQALLSIDMLIILLATLVGVGSCLAALYNMSEIGDALQYEPKAVVILLLLINFWNFAGRVLCGFISEKLVMKYKVPRPLMLSAILFLSCIGLLLIAFPFKDSLFLASAIIGFALGAQLPLVLAIISDIFGLKHYSTLFNCGQMAGSVGSYLLNKELTGSIYDAEAMKLHRMEGLGKPLVCQGKKCFGLSFTIMAIVTFFGGLISLILAARTREFYKGDINKRYRGDDEKTEVASSLADEVAVE
ncbi:protein NUCLEAR FUSION DEFECTIVE 4-like [Alnus glutinosa]|uniref:protein NUCLEAR FUSION DEFECTIVE 4-like n=1 Tax=Alnus glutinosa TaxID=3517 RepID=UPI002D793337|nr:protein NUCLEAR FUSION DEFECTIVE 4-like [Alnus glutinosa]